jgi:FAT domain
MTQLCGSNLPTYVENLSACCLPKRLSVHCYLKKRCVFLLTARGPADWSSYMQHQKAPPNVVYAHLKYMWASGSKEESLNFLRSFSTSLSRDLEAETTQRGQRSSVSKQKLDELARLLARCYFKQGEWQMEFSDSWDTVRGTRIFLPLPH